MEITYSYILVDNITVIKTNVLLVINENFWFMLSTTKILVKVCRAESGLSYAVRQAQIYEGWSYHSIIRTKTVSVYQSLMIEWYDQPSCMLSIKT